MKRFLAVTAIAAGLTAGLPAAPASARCDGKVDVACGSTCSPDYPCTPVICAVYVAPRCVI